jgi:hypothetical protein
MNVETMRADGKQLAGAKADIASLFGTWVNSTPGTDHIAKVTVFERDGALVIRPYGAAAADPIDWGETEATPYVASGTTEVAGFHARYELGSVHTELAANEKSGILVIQSYTSFHDDSGRLSHYAREFFHQSGVAARSGQTDSLMGEWVNSNAATGWIKEFTLTERDGTAMLRVLGASEPAEWGEIPATIYQDNHGEPAFHAVYDLGTVEAVLAANTNKGLIIIAAFLRFKEDGRTNFLCREFYFRR